MHTTTLRAPLRAHLAEARCELVRLAREPAFGVPVLAFPAMFYLLFAVVLNRGNPGAAAYLLASYGAFGVVGAALFGFGVTIAMDRERGYRVGFVESLAGYRTWIARRIRSRR